MHFLFIMYLNSSEIKRYYAHPLFAFTGSITDNQTFQNLIAYDICPLDKCFLADSYSFIYAINNNDTNQFLLEKQLNVSITPKLDAYINAKYSLLAIQAILDGNTIDIKNFSNVTQDTTQNKVFLLVNLSFTGFLSKIIFNIKIKFITRRVLEAISLDKYAMLGDSIDINSYIKGPPETKETNQTEVDNSKTNIIIGVFSAVVFLLVIVILVCYLKRRKTKLQKKKYEEANKNESVI